MPFGLGNLSCLEMLSFFVVGSNQGGGVEELRYLNGLRGNLKITKLERVRDIKEAERANLREKKEINRLSFQWSYGSHSRISSDENLLESLKPNPNIQKLEIKYYMGLNWPSWMLRRNPRNGDFSIINNLVNLSLKQCWNCIQLPCLGHLPLLEFLTLQHIERVKCIYNDSYKQIDIFPALKSLSISWMPNLTEWSSIRWPLDNKVVAFPRLETLAIESCAKLTSFPMKDLSSLVKVEIKDCEELRFLIHEQQSFPSLTNLSIEGCPKLTHVRNWLLSNTRFNSFRVRKCSWLKFIPNDLGLQSSLISLEISFCKGLTFFPENILGKLTRLTKLSIGAFSENLDDFRYLNKIQGIPGVKELEIWGSDFLGRKMSELPERLRHLTRLESLKIMGFTTMKEFPEWLGDLQSLANLSLNYCWHLEYQSVATMAARLSNLMQLNTCDCDTLDQYKYELNELQSSYKVQRSILRICRTGS